MSPTYYFGAQHNIAEQIKHHVFIVGPNNSGTTLLKNLLALSSKTWNLSKEGPNSFGYTGPRPVNQQALLWAVDSCWPKRLAQKQLYDWPTIRNGWYFQSFSQSPEAQVFVCKSPLFLCMMEQLEQHFGKPFFLLVIRNPYAVVEGIARRHQMTSEKIKMAAKHVLNCMHIQNDNISQKAEGHTENNTEDSIVIRYEDLCSDPQQVANQIAQTIPELDDLDFSQVVYVKGLYNEPPRDMNHQQITRMNAAQLNIISHIFRMDEELLNSFGYEII